MSGANSAMTISAATRIRPATVVGLEKMLLNISMVRRKRTAVALDIVGPSSPTVPPGVELSTTTEAEVEALATQHHPPVEVGVHHIDDEVHDQKQHAGEQNVGHDRGLVSSKNRLGHPLPKAGPPEDDLGHDGAL